MRHFLSASLAAALVVAVTCVPAARAADVETQQQQISLRGIKLETPAGQAILHARLKRAAELVCGAADPRDLPALADMKACRQAAMFQAASQMQIAVASAQAAAPQPVVVSSNQR